MGQDISSFEITGLHGHKSIDIRFKDNRLILVGENGSGKTSVLRLLYYFLSGQWALLHSIRFHSLRAVFGDQKINLERTEIETGLGFDEGSMARRYPSSVRDRIRMAVQEIKLGTGFPNQIEEISERFKIPLHILVDFVHSKEDLFSKKMRDKLNQLEALRPSLATHIIYLPTYRRIEEEIHFVVRDRRIEEAYEARRRPSPGKRRSEAIELVEFGMNDVSAAIDGTLGQLKEYAREMLEKLTLGYLRDILDKKYNEVDLTKMPTLKMNLLSGY